MGNLEEESRKRTRKNQLKRIILTTVETAGLLSVALLAPNALIALKSLGYDPGKRQKEIIGESRKKLVKAGLLKFDGNFLKLTEKGETKLRILEIQNFKLKVPKKWDKKWRILIFDIKEERKALRDKVRRTLNSIGFARLQDSVWVYPYDCENLITLLKADFEIGKDMLYIIADAIEYDKPLREMFGLKMEKKTPEIIKNKYEKSVIDFAFGKDEGGQKIKK